MKLTQSIIDANYNLIGFMVEGKASEFRRIGTDTVQQSVTLRDMLASGFSNSQIDCINGRIAEKGTFKIHDLPMLMYHEQNMIPVEHGMYLMSRILVNGELKGFRVMLGRANTLRLEKCYLYNDVITLSTWFKPINFVTRNVNGKMFISGKPGMTKLEELPEERIGDQVDTGKKKRTRGKGATKAETETANVPTRRDLITLYNIVRKCNGVIIKLPNEDYKSTNIPTETVGKEFNSLGIGEIGSAALDFGETKLNANTRFKKPGTVVVNQTGMAPWPVYTFTWSTKHVFYNGQSHMNRIGIAVTAEAAKLIKAEFHANLITREITDKQVIDPIVALTGLSGYNFYEVDTTKLSIMSPELAQNSILSNAAIKKLSIALADAKLEQKILKQGLKKMAAVNPEISTSNRGPIFPIYSGMGPEMLDLLSRAGIDVYTGAFSKREKAEQAGSSSASATAKPLDVEIAYAVKSPIPDKEIKAITYDAIAEGKTTAASDHLVRTVQLLEKIHSPAEQYNTTDKFISELESQAYEIKKTLWMHKIAMFILGNGEVHSHNRNVWKEIPTRKANTKDYQCLEKGCEDLVLRLTGIEM